MSVTRHLLHCVLDHSVAYYLYLEEVLRHAVDFLEALGVRLTASRGEAGWETPLLSQPLLL